MLATTRKLWPWPRLFQFFPPPVVKRFWHLALGTPLFTEAMESGHQWGLLPDAESALRSQTPQPKGQRTNKGRGLLAPNVRKKGWRQTRMFFRPMATWPEEFFGLEMSKRRSLEDKEEKFWPHANENYQTSFAPETKEVKEFFEKCRRFLEIWIFNEVWWDM